jgi:hypothetical protein
MCPADEQEATPQSQVPKKRIPKWVMALIIIAIAIAVTVALGSICRTLNARINGDVRYTGLGMFVIQNNDDFDWVDVRMTLNKVYVYEEDIPAGETRTVYASEFQKSDGISFSIWDTVPKTFSIDCQTPNGKCHTEWQF